MRKNKQGIKGKLYREINKGKKVTLFSDQGMKGRRELSHYLEEDEKVNDLKVCYMSISIGDLTQSKRTAEPRLPYIDLEVVQDDNRTWKKE